MDTRVRDRRRKVARGRGRKRLGLIVTALLGLSFLAGFLWLRSSDVLAVRIVTVPRTTRVAEAELNEIVKSALGANLLRVSTRELEAGLRSLPYVREASVYRRFPDTLEVSLREYEPQARLGTKDGTVWLVADDGRVLGKDEASGDSLPLFEVEEDLHPHIGEDLASPSVVAALPLAGLVSGSSTWTETHPINRITVASTSELTIRLSAGAEIRLGEPSDLKVKLMVASMILDRYIREGKTLEYVDVRVPDRAVAKPKTP
jgi:cell division protein FtsQ